MKINPNEINMFMWKWQAKLYAMRVRRRGYKATVVYEGENWLMLGGRWGVRIDEIKGKTK